PKGRYGDDGSEGFFVIDIERFDVLSRDDRRTKKTAIGGELAAGDEFRSVFFRLADLGFVEVFLFFEGDRAEIVISFSRRTLSQRREFFFQNSSEFFRDRFVNEDSFDRSTNLSGVREAAPERGARR